jgi:predicted dehydrogenase
MPLNLAIIGAGVMGANHARVAATLADVRVALVVDPRADRARAVAGPLGAEWSTGIADPPAAIDAAVLAAPTELHRAIGVPLLRAGIALLVEKPIAATLEDARALIDASTGSAILMVGHVEQFNPAVLELNELLTDVFHVAADRISPYSLRGKESVVLDVMIHDLEIVRRIAASPVAQVQAVTNRVCSETDDYASALIRFVSGLTATVTASRVGQQKIRRLEITQRDSFVSVDLLRQNITIERAASSRFVASEAVSYEQTGAKEIPYLRHAGEPLALELKHFCDAVVASSEPYVSGEDGFAALELALTVIEAAAPPPRA